MDSLRLVIIKSLKKNKTKHSVFFILPNLDAPIYEPMQLRIRSSNTSVIPYLILPGDSAARGKDTRNSKKSFQHYNRFLVQETCVLS